MTSTALLDPFLIHQRAATAVAPGLRLSGGYTGPATDNATYFAHVDTGEVDRFTLARECGRYLPDVVPVPELQFVEEHEYDCGDCGDCGDCDVCYCGGGDVCDCSGGYYDTDPRTLLVLVGDPGTGRVVEVRLTASGEGTNIMSWIDGFPLTSHENVGETAVWYRVGEVIADAVRVS